MNCIIIDDEPLAREEMGSLISEISEIEIVGKFQNAMKAADFMAQNPVDLVFLDIEMPQLSGLEFAKQIPENTLVIFTTAYPQYALKSYELDAIDYLLKPIDKNRLEKAIQKATVYKKLLDKDSYKNTVEGNSESFIFIKSDKRYYKIQYQNILFVEGLKDYSIIHTAQRKLIAAMNLKTIHQKLQSPDFIRVSKSLVVNLSQIESFDNHTIYINDAEIPLGEVYKKDFLDKYADGLLNE